MIVKILLLSFVLVSAWAAAEAARATSSFVVTSLAATEAQATYTVASR